ncbi:MAG TPA: hypothetical protein VIA81_12050 [Acidimicrobiia bacterium]
MLKRVELGLMLAVFMTGCSGEAVTAVTSVSSGLAPPEQVAAQLLAAIATGQAQAAADLTVQEQMPWLAMAEGASIQQAAGLLEEGSEQVAINYWQGFAAGAPEAGLEVGEVEQIDEGNHRFALVGLEPASDLTLVLRLDQEWMVDVVASFGASLATRLAEAVEVLVANTGPDADLLTGVIVEQRDSIEVAIDAVGPGDAALPALESLAGALDRLAG